MTQPQNKPQARDWTKIVADSNGTAFFLPDKLQKGAEEWSKLRREYNEQVKVMAKMELTLNQRLNEVLFAFREELEKKGIDDAFTKDIGFNSEALDEGRFIINFFEPSPSQLPRR